MLKKKQIIFKWRALRIFGTKKLSWIGSVKHDINQNSAHRRKTDQNESVPFKAQFCCMERKKWLSVDIPPRPYAEMIETYQTHCSAYQNKRQAVITKIKFPTTHQVGSNSFSANTPRRSNSWFKDVTKISIRQNIWLRVIAQSSTSERPSDKYLVEVAINALESWSLTWNVKTIQQTCNFLSDSYKTNEQILLELSILHISAHSVLADETRDDVNNPD